MHNRVRATSWRTSLIPIRNWPTILLAGALAIVIASGIWAFSGAPADDAYIVARYARNIHDGLGFVFNPGERINAVTSPVDLATLTLLLNVAHDPIPPYQILAVLAVIAATLWAALSRFHDSLSRIRFVALTLASPFVLFWTLGGLETPLLYSMAIAFSVTVLDHTAHRPRATARAVVLGTLMILTRYDTSLLVLPSMILMTAKDRGSPRVRVAILVCLFALIAWFSFCYLYFGDLLPTSFYVKLVDDHLASIGGGLLYVASFLILSLCVGALPQRSGDWTIRRTVTAPVALWTGVILTLAYGVVAGTVHMMYAYRLFVPLIPIVWLLTMDSRPPPARPTFAAGFIVAAILAIQFALVGTIYQYSQNPNLTLLYKRQSPFGEDYEFSTIGARYGRRVAFMLRRQARQISENWRTSPPVGARPPRLSVDTGGYVPFLLPDAYIFEKLVSFRHRCNIDLLSSADYKQIFRSLSSPRRPPALSDGTWYMVSSQTLPLNGLYDLNDAVVLELWRQTTPTNSVPPKSVSGPCA